jgi:L-fucose mutarotase/ribose pyranase (RbsD/FucU family)
MDDAPRRMRFAGGIAACSFAAMSALVAGCAQPNWRQELDKALPLMGHRNWIVVADSAYPAQSRTGIETVATRAGHMEVLKAVLQAVERAPHVRAKVYVDAEMEHVPEKYAPGIETLRRELKAALAGRSVTAVPHEQLIAKLDEAAKTFNVLILKSDLALPYTSVFVELDCGYWSAEAEAALRKAIKPAKGP